MKSCSSFGLVRSFKEDEIFTTLKNHDLLSESTSCFFLWNVLIYIKLGTNFVFLAAWSQFISYDEPYFMVNFTPA